MAQPALPLAPDHLSLPVASAGVLFASICFGVVPYFSRGLTDAGLAPHAVAFYRYIIAAVILLPVLMRQIKEWRALLWGISAGAGMGLGWIGYVKAVEVAPASTVGVLYMTYPFFTLVLAWVIFRDPPTRRAVIASGLIVLAAAVAANPAAVPVGQIPVLLMSLTAPLGFGFGICVLVYRLSHIPALARIASASVGSVLALLPLVLTSTPSQMIPHDPSAWSLVFGIAILSALIPQLIYVICTPRVGASRTAVIGSVELPTMFAISVLALGETLSMPQIIACGLIVAAIVLTRSKTVRNVPTQLARK